MILSHTRALKLQRDVSCLHEQGGRGARKSSLSLWSFQGSAEAFSVSHHTLCCGYPNRAHPEQQLEASFVGQDVINVFYSLALHTQNSPRVCVLSLTSPAVPGQDPISC